MIDSALEYYNFINPNIELIRHSQKMTYKITDKEKSFALMIHESIHKSPEGHNSDIEKVEREIEFISNISSKGNLTIPNVIHNKYGNAITLLNKKTPVTVLEWFDGNVLDKIEITEKIAYEVGLMAGRFHNDCMDMTMKIDYLDDVSISKMCNKTADLLKQGHFNERQAKIIIDTLKFIGNYFSNNKHKFTIVHGDLSHGNMLFYDGKVVPIDLTSVCYCIPEIDLAMILGCINNEHLNQQVLNAYQSVCQFKLDYKGIDACSCLCILLFIVGSNKTFHHKIDDWCENMFMPLINNNTNSWLRLWKDIF